MLPLISVIVPVYNAEKCLKKCVESLINQTYSSLEIILINDGSTDSSAEICNQFAKFDNRIVVVHQDNKGVSTARNSGINIASGQYIGFVDSDDWIEKSMYTKLFEAISIQDKDINIAICGHIVEDPSGIIVKKSSTTRKHILDQFEALDMALRSNYYQGYMWNKLFRASLFRGENGVRFTENIHIYEDLLVVCECIMRSKKVAFIGEYLYHYILYQKSAMRQPFNQKKVTILDALNKINILCSEEYPELCNIVNVKIIKANLILVLSMINSSSVDQFLIAQIRTKLKANLGMILKSRMISIKEKLYIILIILKFDCFKELYIGIKDVWKK